MQHIENRLVNRIHAKTRGWVFTPATFFDLGSRFAISKALERLSDRGTIRRLARGLYDYPRRHPVLGDLPASHDQIGKALAGRDSLRLQPSGAYAANLLGLTDQVPAKIIFLTDGSNRTVIVGQQQIILRRTTPKNMAASGRISGLVIQALRHLGKDHTDDQIIKRLHARLKEEDKQQLMADIRYAPAWIGEIFKKLDDKNSL